MEKIISIRRWESEVRTKLTHLATFSAFIWSAAPFFVAFVTFATFVMVRHSNIVFFCSFFAYQACFA